MDFLPKHERCWLMIGIYESEVNLKGKITCSPMRIQLTLLAHRRY